MNSNTASRLLLAAALLMLLAGVIFAFIQQWIYMALLFIGAACCMVAAMNFKNQKDE